MKRVRTFDFTAYLLINHYIWYVTPLYTLLGYIHTDKNILDKSY